MNIITRNIPNSITCVNLLSGVMAIAAAVSGQDPLWGLKAYQWAFIFIAIGSGGLPRRIRGSSPSCLLQSGKGAGFSVRPRDVRSRSGDNHSQSFPSERPRQLGRVGFIADSRGGRCVSRVLTSTPARPRPSLVCRFRQMRSSDRLRRLVCSGWRGMALGMVLVPADSPRGVLAHEFINQDFLP